MYTTAVFGQTVSNRIATSWSWYIIRASGFVAIALVVLLMLSGIGFVTGYSYKLMEPLRAWAVHKALSLALGVALILHIGGLLIDKFVPFSLLQVLVPFTKSYTNHTKLFGLNLGWLTIPAGIVSMYILVLVILSSLDTVGWINTKKHAWRLIHLLSYLAMILVFVHTLTSGSDVKSGVLRMFFEVLLGILLIGTVHRLTRSAKVTGSKSKEIDSNN